MNGLVAARVIPDDASPRFVESVTYTVGEPYPRGRIVLRITEVTR